MSCLNFDLYAMVKPKAPEDVLAVLQEAIAELKNVGDILDNLLQMPPAR